jgi:histidinol-phosphate aminotransferase
MNKRNLSRRGFIETASKGVIGGALFPSIAGADMGGFGFRRPVSDQDNFEGRLCYNENPLGPSPLALEAMRVSGAYANRYPDWYNDNIESVIAREHNVAANSICVGCGATELIRMVADAFLEPGDAMITASPTYFQMESEAMSNGSLVIRVPVDENYVIDLDAIFKGIDSNTKMISLVNPNNPQGTIVNKHKLESCLRSVPDNVIVVVDEAYHHYISSDEYESCDRFVREGLPVVVIRTFSKIYGLAGARIGYTVAPPELTGMIAASQLYATVSRPAQAAAIAALDDNLHRVNTITLNNQARAYLESSFTEMGLDYIPSHTNFMMFDTGTSAQTISIQLRNRGFQVRTGWGMPRHIRVSTGTMQEMYEFIEELRDIMQGPDRFAKPVPSRFKLDSPYPNPFNSRCTIRFSTGHHDRVNLTVYDSMGRRVRNLVNSVLPPGNHSAIWDGRNYSGREVASGVYHVNLINGELAESRKVTYIK